MLETTILICEYCSTEGPPENFEIDERNQKGFWCEDCDGFTYYATSRTEKDRFMLILEDKDANKPVIPSSSKKFKKRLSPLRYPGGKSKVIDYLYMHLADTKSKVLVSPFTGGGSFELAMLDANAVESLHLNDLDFGIYSLWSTIIETPYALTEKLTTYKPTHKDYFKAQKIIESDFQGVDTTTAAWATLLVNRLAFSGIAKANPMGGKKGTLDKMLVRWNPDTLIKRINHIHTFHDRITITQEDAVPFIEEAYWNEEATIFIDPPYVLKGKDLYNCYYEEKDHINLAILLDSLYKGMPGADIIVTYDHNEWLKKLYETPEEKIIGRRYSI